MKKYTYPLFILIVLGLWSCNHERNKPGWAYMPDMYYSEPADSYTENEVFRDSITNQMPVEGSIARGKMPYPYKSMSFDDQVLAGKELKNPIEINNETLREGKRKYNIYCSHCHGISGDGNGHLYTAKLYPIKPTSLIEKYVTDKPDGEIYHVITKGSVSGLMGAHGTQVKPEDRWKIINYIREELVK